MSVTVEVPKRDGTGQVIGSRKFITSKELAEKMLKLPDNIGEGSQAKANHHKGGWRGGQIVEQPKKMGRPKKEVEEPKD